MSSPERICFTCSLVSDYYYLLGPCSLEPSPLIVSQASVSHATWVQVSALKYRIPFYTEKLFYFVLFSFHTGLISWVGWNEKFKFLLFKEH